MSEKGHESTEIVAVEPLPKIPPSNGKCMARRKDVRAYCQRPGINGGRCHFCGGKSLSGPASGTYTHGRTSKAKYLPKEFQTRLENINGDVLDNLEQSIEIQKGLETTQLERLKTGESKLLWAELAMLVTFTKQELARSVQPPDGLDPDEQADWLNDREMQIRAEFYEKAAPIIKDGKKAYSVMQEIRRDIQSIHDSQRKLTETLTKSRKEVQETYTEEQWHDMMNQVMGLLRDILLPDQMNKFTDGLSVIRAKKVR